MYRITKCLIVISFIILVGKQIVLYNVKIYKMERRWRQFSLSSYKRIFLPCCDTTFATIMIYVASKLDNEVIKIYKLSKDMICTDDTFDLQNVGSSPGQILLIIEFCPYLLKSTSLLISYQNRYDIFNKSLVFLY